MIWSCFQVLNLHLIAVHWISQWGPKKCRLKRRRSSLIWKPNYTYQGDSKHLRRGQINNAVSASSAKPKGLEDRGGKISENDPRVLSMVTKQHYYLTSQDCSQGGGHITVSVQSRKARSYFVKNYINIYTFEQIKPRLTNRIMGREMYGEGGVCIKMAVIPQQFMQHFY